MFAIRLNSENVAKIAQTELLESPEAALSPFLALTSMGREYYFIRGYQAERGALHPWTLMPGHMFRKTMDYDPVQIETDWNQIVRKEAP